MRTISGDYLVKRDRDWENAKSVQRGATWKNLRYKTYSGLFNIFLLTK